MSPGLEITWDGPPAGWDELVCRLDGTIYHSSFWAKYVTRDGGGRPLFAVSRGPDGEVRAGGVAIYRQSRKLLVSRIFRTLTLPAHPFTAPSGASAAGDFMDSIERLARELGSSRIELESNMSGGSAFVPSARGFTEIPRIEFVADLTRDTDAIWKSLPKDHRERIRALKRKGVVAEEGGTLEDLRGLRAAREATRDRRERQGQGYSLPQDDEFYEEIYTYLIQRGAGRLFIARQDKETVAALFFASFNGKVNSVYSGSTPAGYKVGAQSGLFWTAVEVLKAEGFRELNRGGVPASAEEESDPQHGIYTYKSRLATVPVRCVSGIKVVGPFREGITRLRDLLTGTG